MKFNHTKIDKEMQLSNYCLGIILLFEKGDKEIFRKYDMEQICNGIVAKPFNRSKRQEQIEALLVAPKEK